MTLASANVYNELLAALQYYFRIEEVKCKTRLLINLGDALKGICKSELPVVISVVQFLTSIQVQMVQVKTIKQTFSVLSHNQGNWLKETPDQEESRNLQQILH